MIRSPFRSGDYSGTGPEAYENCFVPTIGAPLAEDLLEGAALRPGERVLDVAYRPRVQWLADDCIQVHQGFYFASRSTIRARLVWVAAFAALAEDRTCHDQRQQSRCYERVPQRTVVGAGVARCPL